MNQIRTNSQNRKLHFFLGKLRISDETKEELVYQFTGNRSSRSSEMSPEECEKLNGHLQKLLREKERLERLSQGTDYKSAPANPREQSAPASHLTLEERQAQSKKRMQNKVISIAHEMRWRKENGKIDMDRVNQFCMKKGHGKKILNDYELKELPKLITQFQKLQKGYYKEC